MIAPILSVKDVDASVAFYTEKLGFTHSFSLPGPDGNNAFAFVGLGKTVAIGLSREDVTEARGQGVDFMIYLPEDQDIDTVYADIQARGVTIKSEIGTKYWGDRTFSVRDPDGYHLTMAATVEQTDMEKAAAVMRGDESAD